MHLFRLLKTASPEANVLAIAATVVLLCKILILNRYPPLFFGAYQIGIIVEAILASVVASYVFYLLVVHVKEISDREILRPYVEKHSKRVIGDCLSQISGISKASDIALDFTTLTETDVFSAFEQIPPYSQAPLLVSPHSNEHANWFQYFKHHSNRSKDSIRKLLDQLPFLDAAHVSIITEIDDCSHFSSTNLLPNIQVRNKDLSVLAKSFYEYCLLCKKLDSHLMKSGFTSAAP